MAAVVASACVRVEDSAIRWSSLRGVFGRRHFLLLKELEDGGSRSGHGVWILDGTGDMLMSSPESMRAGFTRLERHSMASGSSDSSHCLSSLEAL